MRNEKWWCGASNKKRRAVFKATFPREGAARRAGDRETGVQTAYLHIRNRLRNEATVSSVSNIFLMTPYPPAPRRRPLSVKKRGILLISHATTQRNRFPLSHLSFCRGEKDFSTSLEMTIREERSSYIHRLPFCRRVPLRGTLSSAFGAPLLQGAAQLAGKSAFLRK